VVVAPPSEVAPMSEGTSGADEAIPRAALPTSRPAVALTVVPHPADARPLVSRPLALDRQAHQGVAGDPHGHDQRLADQHLAPRTADAHAPVGAPPLQVASAPARPPLPAAGPVAGPPPIVAYRPNVASAPYPVAQPYSGSLLGAARGSMPPAPRPTPVNATYNAN
jgi:hypothetical protein